MAQPGFIDRPMSIALDAVRGAAALVVLLGHSVQQGIYTGPWPFSDILQHQAVVIFFVLSGLVIADSAFRRPTTLGHYAIARFARVMPVAVFAVFFSLLAWAVGHDAPHGTIATAAHTEVPSLAGVVLPLLFLSESGWGEGPLWNAPYWSLAYEVWYYALFGAVFYLRGWSRWLALALIVPLAGLRVLLLLPVWLLGVALARYGPARPLAEGKAALAIVAGMMLFVVANELAFVLAPLVDELARPLTAELAMSRYVLSDSVMAAGVVLVFLGMKTFATQREAALEKHQGKIRWLADCSFTLYLIHWPILTLLHGYGVSSGSNPIGLLAIMALIVAFSGQVARLTEHRRGALRRWLAARLLPGPAPTPVPPAGA